MQAAPGLTELIGAPINVINTLSGFRLTFESNVGSEFKSFVQFTFDEFYLLIRMVVEREMVPGNRDEDARQDWLTSRARETVQRELNLEPGFNLGIRVWQSNTVHRERHLSYVRRDGFHAYFVRISILTENFGSRGFLGHDGEPVPFREHVSTTKLLALCSSVLRDFEIPWSIEMDNKLAIVYELFQEQRYVEIKETGAFKEDLSQRRKYRDLKNKARGEISDELRYAPPRGKFRGGLEFQRAREDFESYQKAQTDELERRYGIGELTDQMEALKMRR